MNEETQIDEAQIASYLALVILAMAILARPLLPTWYDENYTLIFFVDRGPSDFFFDYHLPNNHVLFSFALWIWRSIFGDHIVTSRILSLLLTALAVPGLYLAGRSLWNVRTGVVAAATLALSHIVIAFAGQLRGYGMSIGLVALALGFGARWLARDLRSHRDGVAYAVAGALAIATIPSNVLFVFAISTWLAIAGHAWHNSRARSALPLLAAPLLGFVAYAGMWTQFQAAAEHARGIYTYRQFIGLMFRQVFLYDLPWSLPLIVFGLWRLRGTKGFRPLAGLLLTSIVILTIPAISTVPFDRNLVPLTAFVSLLTAAGFVALADALPLPRPGLAILVGAVFALSLGREAVLWHGEAARFAQAHEHPQNLIDQYYRGDAYNPVAVTAFLMHIDRPSIVIADDAAAMDVPAMLSGVNPNIATCVTARGVRGCALHVGAPRPGPIYVVAPSLLKAQATLVQSGGEAEDLIPQLQGGGYYNVWGVVGKDAKRP